MRTLIFLLVFFLAISCTQKPLDEHSPEASLADLKVYDGLEVELFASEPTFSNPTNIDIDSRGRIWVTEAYNYRHQWNPQNPSKPEGDRIMILEDTDGDGKADKSTVYYQGTDVNAALGICVLGNKVIVSCSPNVFVFTDTDGDDKPDSKEVMFQRVGGYDLDHAIHSFNFGYDGRLYFNMGNEGKILFDPKGDTVTDIHGRKVVTNGRPLRDGLAMRVNEDGSDVEVLGHNFRNNYELSVDPYGTVWQSDNDDDGNKGVRINYVMEFGNYGYRDEMTGAAWQARRTNQEKEIPLRHWHLNDPGVVPNVLQTGSGSPTGLTVYEGTMLPEVFYGQMIHAEPGHNVVRSYPVQNDGAGYKATIVNILEGQKDQWFRPADVAIAPDGSLFVADWYDPGVGGHQVGDLDRGRIYRVAKKKSEYNVKVADVSTTEGALEALISPNPATRYIGWKALEKMGASAEEGLKKLWTSENPRHQAMAFWLLIRLPNQSHYLEQAIVSDNPDFRIMGIRGARLMKKELKEIPKFMFNDPSPQVRREMLIAMRGSHLNDPEAWTDLAIQHDGKDRWYLEALGIAAEENWDSYFNHWKKTVGVEWNTPGGRDIVWRSRSKAALPLLAELIKSSDDTTMLRYYRAFDFHKDPSKQQVLATLVTQVSGPKVLYALKHMDASKMKMTPAINTALQKTLNEYKDKIEFVELISSFNLKDRSKDLLALTLKYPDSLQAREAVRALLKFDRTDLMTAVLQGNNKEEAIALARVIDAAAMSNPKAIKMMEDVMMDPSRDIELRKLAVRAFGGPWESEDRMLVLAKENKIPKELQNAAAGMFQTVWRAALRDSAAKYLTLPGNKNGEALPPVSELIKKDGDASKGQIVFNNNCAQCHVVNGAGTNFGPDLSEIGTKLSPEAMYTAILYPDQGISFGYEGYMLKLNDGSTAVGRIVSETGDKIDLQYMNTSQSVNPADVASRNKLPNSLMPADLQRLMTEEELVDLVQYLKGLKSKELAVR